MKNLIPLRFHSLLALGLLGSLYACPAMAQDDAAPSEAPVIPESIEDAGSDASLPSPVESGELAPAKPHPSAEADIKGEAPTEPVPTDIPQEIQDEADVSGPRVDDSYNSTDASGESFLSQIYVGPTIQIGFPQIMSYSLEALVARTVSFGFTTGTYTADQMDKAELKIKGYDIHARWHPFMGSFFLGAAYGRMELDGTYEDKFTARVNGFEREVNAKVLANIKAKYVSPRLGWFAVWDSGLTAGFELGAQIPLSPETSVDAIIPGATAGEEAQIKSTSDYKDLEKQANDTVKFLGKKTIPIVTLFKVGWMF